MSSKNARIIFMGTPEFAVPTLAKLYQAGLHIVGVITAPDRMGGRGMKHKITSAVKKYALDHELNVLQPKNLKSPEFISQLQALRADLQVVVAFRMLPEVIWNMPEKGTINLHASLLPAYRGAAPINWAIIKGEHQTGLTTFFIEKEIDTGNVLLQREVEIRSEDTAGSLHDRMKFVGADLVLETVQLVIDGNYITSRQNDALATRAPKIFHETCEIDFEQPTRNVYNFIRGLSPYPAAWTKLDGKQLKVFSCVPLEQDLAGEVGTFVILGKNKLLVRTKDGWLEIREVQMEGRKKMPVRTFLNGYELENSEIRTLTM